MRRAARVGLLWALAMPPDSTKTSTPTFVADTTWHVTVVAAPGPSAALTRPLALRIGAAIVVLTLTTPLLYNVRPR